VLRVNQDMYARALKLLLDGPLEAEELVLETGMHRKTANSLLSALYKHKVVHICAWEKDSYGRDCKPVYKLGEGRDKPRQKLTASERQKRYRARKQQLTSTLPGTAWTS